jgi:hypothetical protein
MGILGYRLLKKAIPKRQSLAGLRYKAVGVASVKAKEGDHNR